MKIIVGLGNPGKKYENTRHNIGFLALDYLSMAWEIVHEQWQKKYESEISEIKINTQKILLVKPQTYMNESGRALAKIIKYTNSQITELFVIHDEIDLPLGDIRLYKGDSTAGHQGIASINQELGPGFTRLRVGIENRKEYRIPPTEDYVLQNFTSEEIKKLQTEVFTKTKPYIEKFIEN